MKSKKMLALAILAMVTFGWLAPATAIDWDEYPPACDMMDGHWGGGNNGHYWEGNWYAGDYVTVWVHTVAEGVEDPTMFLEFNGMLIEEKPAPGIISFTVPTDGQHKVELDWHDGWMEYNAYCTKAPHRHDLRNPGPDPDPEPSFDFTSGKAVWDRPIEGADAIAGGN